MRILMTALTLKTLLQLCFESKELKLALRVEEIV